MRIVVIILFLLIFFVFRVDLGNSWESFVFICEENSIVRIRNMKEIGYNEIKEVFIIIDVMKFFWDIFLYW